MRQTIKEIKTNVAYRWFLGYDFTQPIPHFTTFGKNYVRRFQDTDIFETIFARILEEAMEHGFIEPDVVFIDATHVKDSANKSKYTKTLVQQQSKKYQDLLEAEINEDRIQHGKKPLGKKPGPALREVKVSTTDPESGLFVKGEKERVFAYTLRVPDVPLECGDMQQVSIAEPMHRKQRHNEASKPPYLGSLRGGGGAPSPYRAEQKNLCQTQGND